MIDIRWLRNTANAGRGSAMTDALQQAADEIERLRDVLLRNGFVPCDIPACNCGSWHARYGYPERMREIADMLNEAGHALSNENGHIARNALQQLVAERDALVKEDEIKAGVNRALLAEIERLRAAGVGYSQQTVDALSSERDRLRAALIAAMEIVQDERTRLALADSRALRIVLKRIAELDAIIAQADAAMGSER